MVSLEVYDGDGADNHKFRMEIKTAHFRTEFETNAGVSAAERLEIARNLRIASNLLLGLITDGGAK